MTEIKQVTIADGVFIYNGDCREVMAQLEPASIDAIVCDPPYGLEFMGKDWDHGVPGEPFWIEALRVLKPGGHLLAFGGTRTFHRLAVAIEDAGFEIRDTLSWMYGSGFPKSMNLGKTLPEWDGWGTALKPSWEPIVMARKPLTKPGVRPGTTKKATVAETVLKHGTGALNIDATRIASAGGSPSQARRESAVKAGKGPGNPGEYGHTINDRTTHARYTEQRAGESLGRWPANEGCEEACMESCPVHLLDEQSGVLSSGGTPPRRPGDTEGSRHAYDKFAGQEAPEGIGRSSGGASRFYYSSKTSKVERNAGLPEGKKNDHPTVKPIAVMAWLVRMVTPPDGVVLDPFMGSGSTGIAAVQEGFRFIGVDLEPSYCNIAWHRLKHAVASREGSNE